MGWLWLGLAILAEVIGTTALKDSAGFTRPGPSALVVAGYGAAFFLMTKALAVLPLGIVYAVWCGVGIALIALIGWLRFGEPLDGWGLAGIGLILAGVMVLTLMSRGLDRS
jgi:multidrug transporter EmrE-like cation transporter